MELKSKVIDRVGEKYITNEGYVVEIIEYFNARNCTIQFEDGNIRYNIQYDKIKKRKIRNFNHKSVCGKGFIGTGEYSQKIHHKIYTTWKSMLDRCYRIKAQENSPTYKGVLVCEEWCNFQVFAKWYKENHIESFVLDKDILVKGNKVYSPETCCFVPSCINNLFVKCNSNRGKYPLGVNKSKNKFKAELKINSKNIYLGCFDTPEEAFQAYKLAKEKHIKEVADKWKGLISEQVYQAMYNYQVKITD